MFQIFPCAFLFDLFASDFSQKLQNKNRLTGFRGSEAVVLRSSVKKVFLEISQSSQVFSCEFCEISKNTFFNRTPLVAAF